MANEKGNFYISGPLHLTSVDWNNTQDRRSVAASLVQGVHVLERDRQLNRQGSEALGPPWWEFFNFKLLQQLVDNADQSVFGAVFEFKPPELICNSSTDGSPCYVIAFRGTIRKGSTLSRDLKLNLSLIQNRLHLASCFEIAMQTVRNVVASSRDMNIWLAGHSMGSAMAMLAGKHMAKSGIFLEAYLFNPPFFSAPIERIKNKKLKHGIRLAGSLVTAGLSVALKVKNHRDQSDNTFDALSAWVPCLFVNPADHICTEYIGYFEHRKKMEEIGAGGIERLATQNSISSILLGAVGKGSEPLHLIPSANLTVNLSPSTDFKQAHGISQWWKPDLNLHSKVYKYR